MTPFPEDLHEKTAAPVKSAAVAVRQYESLRWHCPNQVCGSKRMLTLSRAAPRVCSLHDRTKPPACQGRNVKSSPLCGTGTLHGCGFRLYTRCVKQKRELVRAKILNVTGGRDEPSASSTAPCATARRSSTRRAVPRAQVAMILMNYVEHVVNAQILFSKQYPLRGRRQPPALFRICCCVLVAIGPLA